MKTINNFIVEHLEYSTFPINEKLKISSKMTFNDEFEYNIDERQSRPEWSMKKAQKGDIVRWNDSDLYFMYKCLNKDLKEPKNTADDSIIFYVAYNFNLKQLYPGPDCGVGNLNIFVDNYTLASPQKAKEFISVLKNKKLWDDINNELCKLY